MGHAYQESYGNIGAGLASVFTPLVALFCLGLPALGQDPPVNASLVGSWDGYCCTNGDIWADGDYAYMPNYNPSGANPATIHIIDISDPSNPFLDEAFLLSAPNNDSSPQDVKVANGLLFAGLEFEGDNSVVIIDVRDPENRAELTNINIAGFTGIHNVFYDNGYLYIADSSSPRVGIIDLTSYDPDNPPATITSALWVIQDVGSVFVHDITVKDGRLYAAGWDSGLWIYDVTNVGTALPTLLGTTPGNNTHSMWPSDDGQWVVTGEERSNGGIKVYQIIDNGGSVDLIQTDELVLSNDAFSVHNQVMIGNRVYVSWYQAGLQVFDIGCDGKLNFVASYDTVAAQNTGGFEGNWGVYPFRGDDEIVLSDYNDGLFIVDISGPPLSFCYPEGRPQFIDPNGGTELTVQVVDGSTSPDPDSVELVATPESGPTQVSPMTLQDGLYVGQFGTMPCGDVVSYYVRLDTLAGPQAFSPGTAPGEQFETLAAPGFEIALGFDFESDLGWSVSGAVAGTESGIWETGLPLGDGDRGDPTVDFDGSGQCFLTGNAAGNTDVDGGDTVLTSPDLSLDGLVAPWISYARWYSNVVGGAPETDTMLIEISDDGSNWSTLELIGPGGDEVQGGWIAVLLPLPAAFAKSASIQLRFTVSDVDPPSVVEAAVDAVEILDLQCDAAPLCPGGTIAECTDGNDDGVRDDGCMWWACVAGTCESTEIIFADMGGANGACPPDGAVDGNDRFHALNCFSNSDTFGNPGYPCAANPPQGFNVDAGGEFGACPPDGVCDGNDAFTALNVFQGTSTCSCPLGGPQPLAPPQVVGHTRIELLPRTAAVTAGTMIAVDAFLVGAVDDLRGYQLHVDTQVSDQSEVRLVDILVEQRRDHVFGSKVQYWQAFNVETAQMVAGLDGAGLPTGARAYLATFIYEIAPTMKGTLTVNLRFGEPLADNRTFLFGTPAHGKVEIDAAQPAVIDVLSANRRSLRKSR